MVKPPFFDINGIKRGAWSEDEDNKLRSYVLRRGCPNWRLLPSLAGLARCGKSCRLRWVNYLQPGLKKGNFTKEEEELIIELHNQLGNKWSAIATKFPGRTDNDIKNHWHAHIKKKRGGLKRNRVVSRGADEIEQSFNENDRCKNPNRQDETPAFDNIFTPSSSVENPEITNTRNPNAINGQDDLWNVVYGLPPLIPEEKFPDFGLCQNDTPTFSDSSDGKITLDEFFDFGLYPNDMSTFSDSSEGGITSRSSDSPTQESDGRRFWSEDDIVDMVLW